VSVSESESEQTGAISSPLMVEKVAVVTRSNPTPSWPLNWADS
jgi:hypothetical protein